MFARYGLEIRGNKAPDIVLDTVSDNGDIVSTLIGDQIGDG